ncbi:MAG TPA: SCO family protein [Opitutaceae bacterium]|nr:SCO family protein [Opitutaceae bacterium]HRJ46712.1 SCO family protein [Opitutaceae bacterium]
MKSYALVLALAGLLAAGCGRKETASAPPADDTGPRYPLTGEILDVDVERRILIVRHDEIPGYMPEMVMEFIASAGDVANARPGQLIRAEMIPSDTGDYRLEKIWPDDRVAAAAVAAGTNALRQDTAIRGRRVYREVGENLPDFALYDQSGAVVQSARFRGKQIMLNFIFTRCPVATMCPAATMKMMETQQLAREAGVRNLELVSITLDPVYDTPGVLKEYADARGIDTGNFSFLTGPEGAIKDLLAQFGVLTEFKGPILNHTLATILINEQGRIVHRFDGSNWEPRDFVAKMRRE